MGSVSLRKEIFKNRKEDFKSKVLSKPQWHSSQRLKNLP
jgi:hypothetical protein